MLMTEDIRDTLAEAGGLGPIAHAIGADADLYAAGLKSLAVVRLMVALEDRFRIEFQSDMLGRATFSSIRAIERAVSSLVAAVSRAVEHERWTP